MVVRDYYTLQQAAEIIGCSVDDLIHFGATKKIKINALTGSGCMYLKEVMRKGTREIISRDYGYVGSRFAPLSPRCFQDFEAGLKDVEALVGIWFGKPEQDIEMLKVLDMDVNYPEMKAKLLKDCKLVITNDELKRFMAPNSATIESQQADKGKKCKQAQLNESYGRFIAVGSPGYNVSFDNKEKFLESIRKFDFETWRSVTPKDGIKEWQRDNPIALRFRSGCPDKRKINQKM